MSDASCLPGKGMSDREVIRRVRAGEVALFEVLIRRYDQRLYRTARAILGDDSDVEDVVQDAYLRAYAHLGQFAGRSQFGTWLMRIAVNAALARTRHRDGRKKLRDLEATTLPAPTDLEQRVADREFQTMLEAAIDGLPESFRVVFMLRDVEQLSIAETAAILEIKAQTVKTRLHRARALLRKSINARVGVATTAAFRFGSLRCDAMVSRVLTKMGKLH